MKKQSEPNKKHAGVIVAALMSLVLVLLGFFIPLSMTDGLEKYSGLERTIARDNLTEFGYPNRGIDLINHLNELKYRIELVKQIDPTTVGCPASADAEKDYVTVISRRTFFGIQDQVTVVTPCGYKSGQSLKNIFPDVDL